tara:strand:+ start:108 stop:488 length:381 start_codon:yes stop_codon:yes gene_type:complete
MAPAYSTHPNQGYITNWINTTGYYTFRANMWSGYVNFGCSWWVNRLSHFNAQVLSGVNQNGSQLGPYQLQILSAKASFAIIMHSLCGCGVLPPIAPPPPTAPTNIQGGIRDSRGSNQDLNGEEELY